ncbi:MAG: hypothetical protein DRI61_12810 [Chloroflexi bacterium]|nr:MAG: hypothetical protein DRI61_12810 [Chloroflexota bacterium]HDN80087.1 hypothetical protein [Chloroflexota bacterium]
MLHFWGAIAIFAISYILIITERVHRTIAALVGGMFIIILGITPQEEAFKAIDLNVVFLLVGMMVISEITGRTGLFQWLAVKAVKLVRGKPFLILVVFSTLTALLSTVLANVTVVVIMTPLILFICDHLRVNPFPYLITQVLASNIGGTATLIGDPPNLLIGSAAGLDFMDFVWNLGPITVLIFIAFIATAYFLFRDELKIDPEGWNDVLAMDERELVRDKRLFQQALLILCLVLVGFFLQGLLHLEAATIALTGAALLLLLSREEPHNIFKEVEWNTIFFFIGLFVLVESLVYVGAIKKLASWMLSVTHSNLHVTSFAILWLSGVVSGIIDNIPYTATMIPLVQELGQVMRVEPIWWSLALGACLGGNATLVGSAANVVVASIAERAGYPITFRKFLIYGALITFESLFLSTIYIWLRYL